MSKFKIFLSHKSKDEALATELADILTEPCSGVLDVYLMEAIPAGKEWFDWIKESVAESSMLLLLFTDETLEWDWCLYEAGLFAGSKAMDCRKVICIHDPKTEQPRQLAHLQSVPADFMPVKRFLENLYLNTPTAWEFDVLAPRAPIDKLATRIVELLLQRAPIKTTRYGKQMEVEVRSSSVGSTEMVVSGDALEIFGLQNKPQPWSVLEKCSAELGHNEWFAELTQILETAREGTRIPRPMRSSFHLPEDVNNREFRPCLYRGEWKHGGSTYFSILFSEEPSLETDRDVARPIANFGELIEGVVDLIDSTPKNTWIKILTLTPALGFLAKSRSEWEKLEKRIEDNKNWIEMVCQTQKDLERWHAAFKGRKTKRNNRANDLIDDDLIKQANVASNRVTGMISRQTFYELPWTDLPDFYLFSNDTRAIIVTPCHLPRFDQPPPERPFDLPYVEMFGSVSNSPSVVRQVQDLQEHYVREAILYAETKTTKAKAVSSGE